MTRPIRKFWLRDKSTDLRWNFTPEYPNKYDYGCPLISPKGLGFAQTIEQLQVGYDYFVTDINSKNTELSGVAYFFDDAHVQRFSEWIGDFKKQFEFHYSPDGKIIAEDMITPSYYKNCVISAAEKSEKNQYGVYEINISIKFQSDVWQRDNVISTGPTSPYGEAHVYPYFYPYIYGGKTVLAVNITNEGSETYPIINISANNSIVTNPEWFLEHEISDLLGNIAVQQQKAKFNVTIRDNANNNQRLEVDSRPIEQHAYVYTTSKQSPYSVLIENVSNYQQPDYAYINFIYLPHGQSRIVFNIENSADVTKIIVSYTERRELI